MTEKVMIKTDYGESVEAIAPVIISASRATDIPAFYSEWFFNRLKNGYCVWTNPFNRRKHYVSFCKCKVVVFWTKNPEPIIPYLYILDQLGILYYFQITLNDYVNEGLEPNLPPLDKRIESFKRLSEMIGADKVIWRFDPILICKELPPRAILSRIWQIGNRLRGYTSKLVFSFVDIKGYRKVQNKLLMESELFDKGDVFTAEGDASQRKVIVDGLVKLREIWKHQGWELALATCAELADLESFGIQHNRCVDDRLMERIFADDKALVYYLHTGKLSQPDLFGEIPDLPEKRKNLKDKGQRKHCGCIISKDIGTYDTCRHFCVYCYANTSKNMVMDNVKKHSPDNESIID